MKIITEQHELVIRALRTQQGDGLTVYAFFVKGKDIVRVADISRIERSNTENLKGFQRTEIKTHVKGIVDYLNHGQVLFPNAIILAMYPEVIFKASRGTKPTGDESIAESGTLTIPIHTVGSRVAWIVDGQQRLTSLYAVVKGQEVIRENYEKANILIAFNPLEEKFDIPDASTKKNSAKPFKAISSF